MVDATMTSSSTSHPTIVPASSSPKPIASYAAGRGDAVVWAPPKEIADAIAFVAGPEARWITGLVIRVHGGTA